MRHHIRSGDLESIRLGRRVWLSASSVHEYAQDREGRISKAVPSLELSRVEAFKAEWDAKRARREASKTEAAALQVELGPHKDGEV